MQNRLKPSWKSFLDTCRFWYLEQIRKNQLRSDYLKIGHLLSDVQDYWKDGENRLLLSVERETKEECR